MLGKKVVEREVIVVQRGSRFARLVLFVVWGVPAIAIIGHWIDDALHRHAPVPALGHAHHRSAVHKPAMPSKGD